MIIKNNFLNDEKILKAITEQTISETVVRVSVLNWSEQIVDSIQGKVISGSINVDGNTAMRRTCSLSLLLENFQNGDIKNTVDSLSLGKKVKIFIGVKNRLKKEFPSYANLDYFWFPQGVFVIDQISVNQSVSNFIIDLSLKDKISLLNGDCGGTLPAAIDFDKVEYYQENQNETHTLTIEKIPLINVIKELLNHWGNESLENIIINNIDMKTKYVVKWMGNSTLYLVDDTFTTNDTYSQILTTPFVSTSFEPGQDIGYWYKDFVYDSNLSSNAGDTVYSVLEKICSKLGNFEFYYDVNGNFIFQEKKNYLNNVYIPNNGDISDNLRNIEYCSSNPSFKKYIYDFSDMELISSYSFIPLTSEIKNDFLVWGERKVNLTTVPIRYHLAIDKKPKIFTTFTVCFYEDENSYNSEAKIPAVVSNGYYIKNGVRVAATDVITTEITPSDWRTQLFLQGSKDEVDGIEPNYYYEELKNEWYKIYNIKEGRFSTNVTNMNYFLDFIENEDLLNSIGVSAIGRRTFVENDSSINCMFESDTPDNIIIKKSTTQTATERQEARQAGYSVTQVSDNIFYDLAIGGNLNSAYVALQDLLTQYTEINENIELSCIPIYFLEPNRIIKIKNKLLGIDGEYFVNSFSIPLLASESMTISATKLMQKI